MPMLKNPYLIYGIVDRTKKIIDVPEMEVLTPIGNLCEAKPIDQLYYENVQHILNSTDKKICVTWSGGIDSTATLAEFLKWTPKDRIVVLLTDNSIKEYPIFYKNYIEKQLECRQLSYYNHNTLRDSIEDGVIITSSIMDHLFGEVYIDMDINAVTKSTDEFLRPLSQDSKDFYQKIIDACPKKIDNVKDLFWYMDYTLDYQYHQLYWLFDIEQLTINKNIFHFGDTPGWNDWSMSTPSEVKWSGTNHIDYKMLLKKHLEKFTHDIYYTENKIKVSSWRAYRNILQKSKRAFFIDTEWVRGY